MRRLRPVAGALLFLILYTLLPNCAGRMVTSSQRVLASADSLFSQGDYLHAKIAYGKVIQGYPNTHWAEEAQYRLGYVSLFYNNPFADWESALAEFGKYQAEFPQGRWIEEVNTWLSVLHTLRSYNIGYGSSSDQTKKFKSHYTLDRRMVGHMSDSLGKCEAKSDSLARLLNSLTGKMEQLEELILKLQ